MTWMKFERAALVATARRVDPDAPTLCDGWTVRHLMAHLVQRERHPVRLLLDMLSSRAPGNERFMRRLVDEARSPAGYRALVDRFEQGGPWWQPLSWMGDRAHLLEYLVHHEDIRRGGDPPEGPRALPDGMAHAVMRRLAGSARWAFRRSPVGVALEMPGLPATVVRPGGDAITITGPAAELALHAYGRRSAADVEISGSPSARERYAAWAG